MNSKLLSTVMIAAVLAFAVPAYATAQTTTTVTTATTEEHHFHPDHWQWRQGLENPYGVFQGNNVVVVPAVTLAQSVVNTCPAAAPVLLSTGQCITTQQALYEIQTGQIQVGGQVQTYGQVIVGTPTVLGAQGFTDPFAFFHEHHFHQHDHEELNLGTTVTTTP